MYTLNADKKTGKVRDTSKKRKIACAFVSHDRAVRALAPPVDRTRPAPAWRKYARDRVAR